MILTEVDVPAGEGKDPRERPPAEDDPRPGAAPAGESALGSALKNPWLILIMILIAIDIAVTALSIQNGLFYLYSQIFYLPIVFVAYHYPRWGVAASLIMAAVFVAINMFFISMFASPASVVSLIFIEGGMIVGIGGLISMLFEATKNREEKYETIFLTSQAGVFTAAPDFTLLEVNKKFCEILGCSRTEIVGQPLQAFFYTPEPFEKFSRDVGSGGTSPEMETRLRATDGSYRDVILTGSKVNGSMVTGIILDITSRKQADADLKESEWKFRNLIENAHEGVVILNSLMLITYANPAFLRIMGYRLSEVHGKNFSAFLTPEQEDQRDSGLDLGGDGVSGEIEVRAAHKDGTPRYLRLSASPYFDDGLSVSGLLVMVTDMTAQKKTEEVLRENEARLRVIISRLPTGVILIDQDTWNVVDVNPVIEQLIGAPREKILGESWNRFVTAGKRGPGKERGFSEEVLVTATGEERPILATLVPVDISGKKYFLESIVDITEQKEAERAIREQLEFVKALMNTIPGPIYYTDSIGAFLGCNTRFASLFGVVEEEIVGHTPEEIPFLSEDLGPDQHAKDLELLSKGGVQVHEGRVNTSQGKGRTGVFYKSTYNNAEGYVAGLICFIVDITDRKREQESLEDSLREKEVLLREIHHRVKNNMQIISALMTLQQHNFADPAALQMLQECQGCIRTMSLVHEQLYHSGSMREINAKKYLSELLSGIEASYLHQPGVRILSELDDIPLSIDTAIPLGLIVNELVTNAIKYAFRGKDEGTIRVSMRGTPDGFTLTVKDDGIGLPPDIDPEKTESLGLQLVFVLSRQIDATVEIVRDQGTCISIHVPR
ncbi:PAS domain S-box-containing protein [Methanolinea mesophila]|uniref:PAS domain S-box protein n=1 Tax=Methanolinea mesophila TaxID=547055 RepID=UPI001AEA019E|nr:PAS domain S-box protein [Methanolinea mesophila]MBP1928326.1 PAS domain S-box-containing protein [Methanolinea mesophila]